MKLIQVAKRLLSRRITLLHTVLLALAMIGLLAWLLGSNEKWLVLPAASFAFAFLLLGIQLQFSVDSTQTLKNNSQRRHTALKVANDRLVSQTEQLVASSSAQADTVGRQLKAVSQDLARIESTLQSSDIEQPLASMRADLARIASGSQILSDQQRFRFAEVIDLYQDQADRQQAFELRLRHLLKDVVETAIDSSSESEPLEVEVLDEVEPTTGDQSKEEPPTAAGVIGVDALIEAVWPSVQNHIWLRDLYSRSGSIAPRNFLASPENMKAGSFLGNSQRLLIDWGIDSLTFHLAEERSRVGMITVAVESDDRLADLAAQALGGSLKTVSTATLATNELGYELAGLIDGPAGVLVSNRLEDKELQRFAGMLDALTFVECVYLTAAMTFDGGCTADVLTSAGFSLSEQDETSEIDKAGLELWERVS
ncbi:hypothetical protein SAMN04487917_101181 [Arthrobacter sp. yr096]|uniref:hypothetical protein n=1 Tax=Arthrobacter sp. yr096 TaxID=1761750 RepID=UPI0008D0AE30|nr:hypothetical protein [Arthrobacter sp. yr096]SEI41999.1 hypothetical protein SAMN04487917_101181 [Arthrobacter sp. yr096]